MLSTIVIVTLNVGEQFSAGIVLVDKFTALEHLVFEGSDAGFGP